LKSDSGHSDINDSDAEPLYYLISLGNW